MILLYMDENVRFEITLGLRSRDVDVMTVQEDGMASASDPDVLDRATALRRVLFTNDEDFVIEAASRQRNGTEFYGIIFAHPMDVTIGTCIADLELIAKLSEPEELLNQLWRLPL